MVTSAAKLPPVEIGWVLAGPMSDVDVMAAKDARNLVLSRLRDWLPGFDWRITLVARKEALQQRPAEPIALVDVGVIERDAAHWDFAIVLTEAELKSYDKPFALGAPAHSLDVGVLSTARIDPQAVVADAEDTARESTLAKRIAALALHLLGHLAGAAHSEDPHSYMYDLRTVADLDAMRDLDEDSQRDLAEVIGEVADQRLEETARKRTPLGFYLSASWLNRREIVNAIGRIAPWQFPFRFSRLTTAAASTMVVFLITAEAWELGMHQEPLVVTGLSLVALLGTSSYMLKRQQLLTRLRARRLTEQRVVSNVSIVVAVVLGMLTTYLLLFGTTLFITRLVFDPDVVTSWALAGKGYIGWQKYLTLSAFVASLGIIIGALGASFEQQHYFRHVTILDEET